MSFSLKKVFSIVSLFLFLSIAANAEEKTSVKFLGIFSADADKNMLNMTEDFYYKQIAEYDINLTYSKNETFQTEFEKNKEIFFANYDGSYIFFIEIKKSNDTKWICEFNLRKTSDGTTKTITREYESYYKILMESKTALKQTFFSLFDTSDQETLAAKPAKNTGITTDAISGTWQSTEPINKIVIMRGGRGFIIFKNGATMNIKISISESNSSSIIITQASGNNASFYPELERKAAMEYAVSAEPVKWELFMQEDGSLKGTKNSPVAQGDSVIEGTIPVTWTKLN